MGNFNSPFLNHVEVQRYLPKLCQMAEGVTSLAVVVNKYDDTVERGRNERVTRDLFFSLTSSSSFGVLFFDDEDSCCSSGRLGLGI